MVSSFFSSFVFIDLLLLVYTDLNFTFSKFAINFYLISFLNDMLGFMAIARANTE